LYKKRILDYIYNTKKTKNASFVYSIGAEANPPNKELLLKVKEWGSWQYKQSGPDYSFEVSSLSALQPIRVHFIAYPPHKINSFSAMV
jgi:hypothetical protein